MAIPVVQEIVFKNFDNGSPQTEITITKPANVAVGNLLLIMVMSDDNGGDDAFQDTKSGWSVMLQAGNSSSDAKVAIYYRIADGLEDASETVTMDAEDDVIGWYFRMTGNDTNISTVINAFGESQSSGSGSSRAIPGITTDVDDCLAFYFVVFDGADGGPMSVSGTGWTETEDRETSQGDSTDTSGSWGNKDMASFGATGTATVSFGASDGHAFGQFAVAPVAAGGAPALGGAYYQQYIGLVLN